MIEKLREPFNTISHALGAFLALIGLGVLIYLAEGPKEYVGVSLFGFTLVFLYSASALFHGLKVSKNIQSFFQQLDRVAIHSLIAGTASAIALIALRGWNSWALLGIIWFLAIAGIVITLLDPFHTRLIPTLLYMTMGWIPIVFIVPLLNALSPLALTWCIIGGLLYTVGAVVYLYEGRGLSNEYIGSHEIWHVFTLLGSGAHYLLVAAYTL